MENLTLTIPLEKLQQALIKQSEEIITGYSSPVKTLLENAFKEKDSEIKAFVTTAISECLLTPEFKIKMQEAIMAKMIESSLRK